LINSLNFISPICQTGYGIAGTNLLVELDKQLDLYTLPISKVQVVNPDFQQIIQNSVNRDFIYDAPCLRLWHQHDLSQYIGKGLKAAFPIFELNRFPDRIKHHLAYPDLLFVCSKWAQQIIKKEIGRESVVTPLGVDTNIFYPMPNPTKDKQPNYVFFMGGKIEKRKGHDILVDLFNKAFTKKDKVELWLLWHNPFLPPEEVKKWHDLYSSSKMGSQIHFVPPQQFHQQIAQIMNQIDCGLCFSRAEGWNLEALELMAMGKPVIVTNYSGHTEFCTKDNSFLIDIEDLEPAQDHIWFHGEGDWAEIGKNQEEQIIEYMRRCYKERPGNVEGVATARQFSWKNTAKCIIEGMSK